VGIGLNTSTAPYPSNALVDVINAADFPNTGDAVTLSDTKDVPLDIGYNFVAIIQYGQVSNTAVIPVFYGAKIVGNILC